MLSSPLEEPDYDTGAIAVLCMLDCAGDYGVNCSKMVITDNSERHLAAVW